MSWYNWFLKKFCKIGVCDKCGAEIKNNHAKIAVKGLHLDQEYELCQACFVAIVQELLEMVDK